MESEGRIPLLALQKGLGSKTKSTLLLEVHVKIGWNKELRMMTNLILQDQRRKGVDVRRLSIEGPFQARYKTFKGCRYVKPGNQLSNWNSKYTKTKNQTTEAMLCIKLLTSK